MDEITIYLANEHALFADGLSRILMEKPGIVVDKIFHDSENLLAALHQTQPDLLFYDVTMPGLDDLDYARQILDEYHQMKIVLVSITEEVDKILPAVKMGVHGCIMKDTSREELFEAIDAVMHGDHYYSGSLGEIISKSCQLESEEKALFTKRQKQILEMISEGHSSKSIASNLNISVFTVETHRKNILCKAGCNSTIELMRVVRENNWV